MSKARFRGPVSALIAAALIGCAVIGWTLVSGVGLGQEDSGPADNNHHAVQQAKSLSRAFRSAAKEVLPTVVEVRTATKPRRAGRQFRSENPFEGTPLEDFFGDSPDFWLYEMPGVPRPGLGSGVIIDPSGVVLTNNHVVAGADEVVVRLGDGRQFDVTEIKTDERTDLAVLRLKANETLPAARLGDSSQMEIGDWVLAIGSPFELEQTVSAGIISGKGRQLEGVRQGRLLRARLLQTDAAINPGNSGGPLVNLDGEVIGVNTAIASRTGGYQGIGFAIPISQSIKWVVRQLVDTGTVARAYLGVSIVDMSAAVAEEFGVPLSQGIAVAHVGEGSPAEKAGLRKSDVIVSFDGRQVQSTSDLQEVVERSPAGSQHEMRILRQGKPQTLTVQVEAMPDDFEVAMSRSPEGRSFTSEFYRDRQLGLVVIDLTEVLTRRLGYEGFSGVLIFHVDRDRIAAQAGLREGMLITRVGEKPVGSVADFKEAIEAESLQRGVELEVQTRRGKQVFKLQSSSG